MNTRAYRRTLAIGALGLAAGCGDVPRAFGPTPVTARTNADELFGGFAERFTNVNRTPRYARARELIGAHALTPSDIYADTSVWTAYGADGTRTLFGDASFANGRYTFTNVVTNSQLERPGDGRHIMRLRKIGDGEYEWFAGVDFAAGRMTAADFASVVSRWMASAEGHSPAEIRAAYRAAFPRTTSALGALYSLDSVSSVRTADGANDLVLGVRVTPAGIRSTYPNFADYMEKYALRLKMHFVLADARGAWVDVAARDGFVTLHLRSRDGHFAPLSGPARMMPDTLVMKLDMTTKIKLFTVGVERMTADWVNVSGAHDRGWVIRFAKEPSWVLPPAVGFIVKSSLARPFQGAGTQFRFTVHDQPGAQTLLTRRTTTVVQESAVIRFLGRLGGAAMGDFVSKAEDEENRFDAGVFNALRTDVDAALR